MQPFNVCTQERELYVLLYTYILQDKFDLHFADASKHEMAQ